MYHHSDLPLGKLCDQIPREAIKDLRNPVVNKAISSLRLLVNQLLRTHGRPEVIHIEFARELRKSKKAKERQEKEMRNNERENNIAKAKLKEHGVPCTTHYIRKMRLWMETKGWCVYTGKRIGLSELFTSKWDLEHIVPKPLSQNNNLFNLTLCPPHTNQEKGKRTPYQAFGHSGKVWEDMKEHAKRHLPEAKYQYFVSEKEHDMGFVEKQSRDNAYIAKEARKICQTVCRKVKTMKSGITALLRHHWGLNTLLTPAVDVQSQNLPDGWYYVAVNDQNKYLSHFEEPVAPWKEATATGDDKADQKQAIEAYKAWQQLHKRAIKEKEKALEATIKKQKEAGMIPYGRILYGEVTKEDGFVPEKNRDDYRHNLIDAIVVAFATKQCEAYFSRLNESGKSWEALQKVVVTPPHADFRNQVETLLNQTLVFVQQTNRHYEKRSQYLAEGQKNYHGSVRGPLHKDTIYGKRSRYRRGAPGQGEPAYHVRSDKPLYKMSAKDHDAIVDPTIRNIVKQWAALPAQDRPAYPLLHNKKDPSNPVPIKKVRIMARPKNLVQLAKRKNPNQWVATRNNYIAVFYKDSQGKWYEQVITFWEAVKRKKAGLPIVEPTYKVTNKAGQTKAMATVHFTLRHQDYFVLGLTPAQINGITWDQPTAADKALLHKHLYRVAKFTKRYVPC